MLNCRIAGAKIQLKESKPTLNEFVMKRPRLQRMDAVKVILLYDEYLIDNHQEIAADQKSLDIWDL